MGNRWGCATALPSPALILEPFGRRQEVCEKRGEKSSDGSAEEEGGGCKSGHQQTPHPTCTPSAEPAGARVGSQADAVLPVSPLGALGTGKVTEPGRIWGPGR